MTIISMILQSKNELTDAEWEGENRKIQIQ